MPEYVCAAVGRKKTVKEVVEWGLRASGKEMPPTTNCEALLDMLSMLMVPRLSLVITTVAAGPEEFTVTEPKLSEVEEISTEAWAGVARKNQKTNVTAHKHTNSVLLMSGRT